MRILKTLFLSGLLQFAFNSWAQNTVTDSTATVVSYWYKNDITNLQLTKTKEKYEDGQLISTNSSKTLIEVKVLNASKDSYTIEWKYKQISVPLQDQNPMVLKLLKLSEGLEVVFKTDELGTFIELVNWKSIQKFINKSIDEMAKSINSTEFESALKKVKSIYSTRESIENIAIKDIQLYHSLYGGEYKLNEELSFQSLLPNVLGGEPFPSLFKLKMTELRPDSNYCKIETTQEIDGQKLSKEINKWVENVSDGESKNSKKPKLNLEDFSEFEIDLLTGWLTLARNQRVVVSENIKVVEILELKKF